MKNPWKLATVAVGLIVATAFTSGLTTAYLMDSARESGSTVSAKADVARGDRAIAAARPTYAQARTTLAGGPARPAPVARAPRPTPVAYPSSVPADCDTTGDRIWRIAKPGALGGLLGAGVGAAGGAIADGGKGAGKGALIGGLVGAAAGSIYGGYMTKKECGSVFGSAGVVERQTPLLPDYSGLPEVALQQARAAASGDNLINVVYRAR